MRMVFREFVVVVNERVSDANAVILRATLVSTWIQQNRRNRGWPAGRAAVRLTAVRPWIWLRLAGVASGNLPLYSDSISFIIRDGVTGRKCVTLPSPR